MSEAEALARIHPIPFRFTSQLVLKIMAPPTCVVDHARPPNAQSPFACHERYSCQGGVQHHLEERYPFFLAHASSCAKPVPSTGLRVSTLISHGLCRLLRAPAGNCSARRYLCKSFPGCLSHDPVGLWGAYACSFPHIGGLPQEPQWVGFPASVPQRDFMRGEFSRSSLFLTFRPPGLFATPVSPTAAPLRPQGSRDFYTRADHASLPLHALGMLAV